MSPSRWKAVDAVSERCSKRLPGLAVWFTGLSGSGKTTLCCMLAEALLQKDVYVRVLDGDEVRRTFCAGLGFSHEDREENIRRIGTVAEELVAEGAVVLVAAISPYRAMRESIRRRIPNFVEVYVNAPLDTCIERDPKGLYRRALANEIPYFTGISDPYEPPLSPEIECETANEDAGTSALKVIDCVMQMLQLRETPTHVIH
jgi:adenylyl-sulfate kinase